MASYDDVARIALALPEVDESVGNGRFTWRVKKRAFAWERPLRPADWHYLGIEPHDGQVLAVSVESEDDKLGLMDALPDSFFTTPHFDGYPAVLVWLDHIPLDRLEEAVVDAWIARAPKRLASDFLADVENLPPRSS